VRSLLGLRLAFLRRLRPDRKAGRRGAGALRAAAEPSTNRARRASGLSKEVWRDRSTI
jgi:hypothetical protein